MFETEILAQVRLSLVASCVCLPECGNSVILIFFRGYKEKRDAYIRKLNGIYQNNLDKSKVEVIKGKAKFIGKVSISLINFCNPSRLLYYEAAIATVTLWFIKVTFVTKIQFLV